MEVFGTTNEKSEDKFLDLEKNKLEIEKKRIELEKAKLESEERQKREERQHQLIMMNLIMGMVSGQRPPGLNPSVPQSSHFGGPGPMLIHWNPAMQYWEISSKTCTHLTSDEQEVYNSAAEEMTVKVCNTYKTENETDNSTQAEMFSRETMFIIPTAPAAPFNSPPVLNSTAYVTIKEDSGKLTYQLVATDEEGDTIQFEKHDMDIELGNANLTSTGLLTFKPCLDCVGLQMINFTMYEIQVLDEIQPKNTTATIFITIEDVNDPPVIFIARYGRLIMNSDPTEPILVLLEAKNDHNSDKWNSSWMALVGAYDPEFGDQVNVSLLQPSLGNVTLTNINTSVPELPFNCSQADAITEAMMPCQNFLQSLPRNESLLSWMTFVLTFSQPMNVFGNFTTKMYFSDTSNGTSLPFLITFAIMESPCHNLATCDPIGLYPCFDTHRTHSFDLYYRCQCAPGWQSTYCDIDINECLSNPCISPYVCYNKLNHYECDCPLDNPNCEFEPWLIAIIVLASILLIILISTGIFRLKYKRSPLDYETDSRRGSTSTITGSASSISDGESYQEKDDWSLGGASGEMEFFGNPNFDRKIGKYEHFENIPPKKEAIDEMYRGYRNPALDLEPEYDHVDERTYHKRHTQSNFEPLLPSKYEQDLFPANIPPVLTGSKRGKVMPDLLDEDSPYYPPPPYQLMNQGKNRIKKKRKKRGKVSNKDLDESFDAGRQTPTTQVQKDYAKIHPVNDWPGSDDRVYPLQRDLSLFSQRFQLPRKLPKLDTRPSSASRLRKVFPATVENKPDQQSLMSTSSSLAKSESIRMTDSNNSTERTADNEQVMFESEM